MTRRRMQDDGAFVATEWLVGTSLLVLPVMVLVALLPAFASRHEAVAAAAREGARAAAHAPTGSAAAAAASQAVVQVLDSRGLPAADAVVTTMLTPAIGSGALPRTGQVAVSVSLPMPPVALPLFGTISGPTVVGDHHRALDPYRTR